MRKRAALGLLICVNVALLAAIVLKTTSPQAALAQAVGGLNDNYMVVTGEIQDGNDAIYIVDVKGRALHVFIYDRGRRVLQYASSRNLERDFRN